MREIKFRAWDKDCEMMFYSDKTYDDHFYEFCGGKLFCISIIENGYSGSLYDPPSPSCEELDNIMQFTGLYDKNGKGVWEGDIVERWGEYWKEKSVVTYGDGYYIPLVRAEYGHNCIDTYDPDDFEVIGNIYENPELLEKDK